MLSAAVAVSTTTAARAQTELPGAVPNVTTEVPEAPRVPATPTPTVPATTTDKPLPSTPTPTPPQAPTTEDLPRAPSAGAPAERDAKPKTELPKPGVNVPAAPARPGGGDDAPAGGSNGGGSRGGSSGGDDAPKTGSSGSGSRGDSAGAGSSTGSNATGEGGSNAAAATGNGGRRPTRGRPAGALGSPLTDTNWLALALDPRFERLFTRRLTETVVELERCLSRIGTRDRRVLSLRAGLGGGEQRSRAAVARRLDLTRAGVAATEQGALRDLLRAARSGACGQDAATAAAGYASAATPGGMGDGWAIDRLRFGSLMSSASSTSSGGDVAAAAAGGLGPALLDADPFSRVSVAGSASTADAGGHVLGFGSWLEAMLVAVLIGLLALLAWLAVTRARRAFREPRTPHV